MYVMLRHYYVMLRHYSPDDVRRTSAADADVVT